MSLAAVGREAEALDAATRMEATTPARFRDFLVSAHPLIERKPAESIDALDKVAGAFTGAEALFYVARQFAHLGAPRRAVELLERAVDGGYVCCAGLNLQRVDEQHRTALATFHSARGSSVLRPA